MQGGVLARRPLRPKPKPRRDEQLFAAWIRDRKILVADPSSEVRTGIARMLQGLGAAAARIHSVSGFEAAQRILRKEEPEVVVCDYHLGNHCGLELIPHLKRGPWQSRSTLFILVTSDRRDSVVAEAAEEEVDSFIAKPFSLKGFREHLLGAFMSRAEPGEYRRTIEEAKQQLAHRRPEEALKMLERARELSPRPALAHYYLGRAHQMKRDRVAAEREFRAGLEIDPRHYKCLNGLLDLLIRTGQSKEAYAIARRLLALFPISAARLDSIVRLAVRNQMFEDVEAYFLAFNRLDPRPPTLVKCMVAALLVAGKFHLKQSKLEEACRLFDGAVAASLRAPEVLRPIVLSLIEAGETARADSYLKVFPLERKASGLYQVLQFHALNARGSLEKIIRQGRQLIRDGIRDPDLYGIMIRRSHEAKLHRSAEALVFDAVAMWPERKEEFLQLIPE